jgi:hypothetical protein
MKCSTCKFWTLPEQDDNAGWMDGVGTCKAVVPIWQANSHDNADQGLTIVTGYDDEDVFDIPLAFVADGSAALKTKGDFSCCLYEDKELPS